MKRAALPITVRQASNSFGLIEFRGRNDVVNAFFLLFYLAPKCFLCSLCTTLCFNHIHVKMAKTFKNVFGSKALSGFAGLSG
jgi:hypothetical protein